MAICGTFLVSKTPEASVALQVAAKKALANAAKKTTGIRNFAAEVQSQLESSMGSGWHVLVGVDFAVDLRYRKGACVLLFNKTSKMKVMVYRTTSSSTSPPKKEHEALLPVSAQVSVITKSIIYESTMEEEMKETVMNKTKQLYNHYKDAEDSEAKIAQALKHSLTFAYGPTWQVIVSSSPDLCCLPIADAGTHADFTIAKGRVVVYRHAGTSLDRQFALAVLAKRVTFLLALLCMLLAAFMSLTCPEMVEKCKSSATVVGDNAIEDNRLPEGCTKADVVRANDHTWWKTRAVVGTSGFTMLASLCRMYSKTLASKVKRS